jgi:hypothetical protein
MLQITWVGVATVLLVAGCSKAPERAAEKMIESQIAGEGGKAKVDMSAGGIKISSTDASGKSSQIEIGSAQVTAADVGVPFYPGTQPREGESSKVSAAEGTMVTVMLHADDAPDKVATFYRDHLRGAAQGKQFMESSADGSHTLMLSDDQTKHVTQVMVAKGQEKGSDIHIVTSRGASK